MSALNRAWLGVLLLALPAATGRCGEASGQSAGAELLRSDWLFQAAGKRLADRALKEIQWTRDLAVRLQRDPATPDLSADLAELAEIARKYSHVAAADDPPLLQPVRDSAGLPEGLIARWAFEGGSREVLKDVPAHGRNGKPIGNIDRAAGVYGSGLSLDGDAAIDVGPELSGITRGPYTITAWIKTTDTEADILGNGVGRGCFLLMSYRGVVRGHQWTTARGNVVDGKTAVNDDRWHHVAQVVDDQRITLFVDGAPDASAAVAGERVTASGPVLIGARSRNQGSYNFVGVLDDVCVFDRALSAESVRAEFEAGKAIRNLDVLASSGEAGEFYLAVRRLKRRIMFKNPAVDFSKILLIDNPYPTGREWPHQARHRNGMMAVAGGRLLVLDGLRPGGRITQLAPAEGKQASFWRPDLSFDAKKVLFCMKPADEQSFHLYEIDVDGTDLRQLTDSRYDDLDPIYLPDGHILFSSTRGHTYIRCMPYTYCYVLARCDADGRNIYMVSRNNECDWLPTLLNDGRVVYSRWEYHDKALWRVQSLWAMNQDGTGVATFWGNQSVWPDHLAEPRPIPGSPRIMFTGLAHHDWFAGSIGILDPRKGVNFPNGLRKVTADVAWPECGRPPLDRIESPSYHAAGKYTAYKTPYPLGGEDFLVSARAPWSDNRFNLYLMDVYGNRELIYSGRHNVWHAMPLKPRSRPPAKADSVAWPGTGDDHKPVEPGVFYSIDVYQGVPDLPRGKAKYVRAIQMDYRTYSTWDRDGRFSGPVVSAIQDDGVKRILGTAVIEKDGSVAFEAPPGKSLHFQLLDEHYRALQTMRSFTGVMPGERRGCVGCHEMQQVAPVAGQVTATSKRPQKLVPPPWGAEVSVGYERLVQPVLEKHCGKCHRGDGKGREKLDLTLRPGAGPFQEPYLTLVGRAQFFRLPGAPDGEGVAGAIKAENYAQSDPNSYVTFRPMQYLSYTSKLVENAMSGEHHDVKVTGDELRQLIGWVDANCPYRGDEEIRRIPDPDPAKFAHLPIRPRTRTAPRIDRFNVPQDHVTPDR